MKKINHFPLESEEEEEKHISTAFYHPSIVIIINLIHTFTKVNNMTSCRSRSNLNVMILATWAWKLQVLCYLFFKQKYLFSTHQRRSDKRVMVHSSEITKT